MKILDVFTQYSIPKNLQNHMFRVAAVGKLICDHLLDPHPQANQIIQTLLLHDMGNILKFNLDRIDLLDPSDLSRLDDLKKIQQDFKNRYGPDPDEATLKIMVELGVGEYQITLCRTSHGTDLESFLKSKHLDKQICFYSDMRVGPHGVIPIMDRFDDFLKRYPHEHWKTQYNRCLTLELEQTLQHYVNLPLTSITDSSIKPILPQLRNMPIQINAT